MKPDSNNRKPVIPQAWLRVLMFCIVYLAAITGAGFLFTLVFPQQDAKDGGQHNVAYTSILYLVTAIVSVAVVWLFRTQVDRASLSSIGLKIKKQLSHAGAGFFLGLFLLCAGSCILFFTGNLVWTGISFNATGIFNGLVLMIIIAIAEEFVFRGYILNNLLGQFNRWLALIISALLFMAAHVVNPAFSVVAMINLFLAGLLLGINYMYTRNLWFGIFLHFAWNFFQGSILGYEVSGMPLQSLLQHQLKGNPLLTGGNFGFEGSLVATLLSALTIVALATVYEKKSNAAVAVA